LRNEIFHTFHISENKLELTDQGGRKGKDMNVIIRKMLCLCNLKRRNRLAIEKNMLEWTLTNVLEAGMGSAERS